MISRNGRARVSLATTRDVVAFATRAPSIHNTQPWVWRIQGSFIELRADRGRQLRVADAAGRHLTISCGAALHHAVVRARALGLEAEVELLPTPDDPDLLATILLVPGRPDPGAAAEAELLTRRRTDRRRFTAWPLPDNRLDQLVAAAVEPGTDAVTIGEPTRRVRVGLLVRKAQWIESNDPHYAEEEARWAEPTPQGGVPETHRPAPHPRLAVSSRYDDPDLESLGLQPVQGTDGLVVITTPEDGPRDWLRAGTMLCRLWTEAMTTGLSLVPLSQLVEVAETRAALAGEVAADAGHPQLLLRLGWQEISRDPLPPSGRRPLDDVLLS